MPEYNPSTMLDQWWAEFFEECPEFHDQIIYPPMSYSYPNFLMPNNNTFDAFKAWAEKKGYSDPDDDCLCKLCQEIMALGDHNRNMREGLFVGLAHALEAESKQAAWKILFDVRHAAQCLELDTQTFYLLYMATVQDLVIKYRNDEYSMYEKFPTALVKLLPGATIVERKSLPGGRPDFFIEYNGATSPVEIKRHRFINTSVKQLQRYMDIYGMNTGFVVAPKLSGLLLPGMTFLAWSPF